MEKYTEILKQIKGAQKLHDDADARIKATPRRKDADPADLEAVCFYSVLIDILKHNARAALYSEVLPAVVAVLEKYKGKKHGKKTADKIITELYALTGVRIYLKPKGFKAYIPSPLFYGLDLDVYTPWINGEQAAIIDNENKIHAHPAEAFRLYDYKYFDNPAEAVKACREAHAAAVKAIEEARAAVTAFNAFSGFGIKELDYISPARAWIK